MVGMGDAQRSAVVAANRHARGAIVRVPERHGRGSAAHRAERFQRPAEREITAFSQWLQQRPRRLIIAGGGMFRRAGRPVAQRPCSGGERFGAELVAQRLPRSVRGERLHSGHDVRPGLGEIDRRLAAVRELAQRLRLSEVRFAADRRSQFLGHELDHIYTRDLATLAATATAVSSSDHNPVTATLRLAQ